LAPLNQREGAKPRSPIGAAVLSFLWPGLGQWYIGRGRRAVVHAAPVIVVAALLVLQLAGGLTSFAIKLLDPSFSLTLLILVVLLGGWRIVSVADAASSLPPRSSWRTPLGGVVSVLIAAVLLSHGLIAYYTWSFYEAGSQIFVGSNPDIEPTPGPSGLSTFDPFESAAPFATPRPQSQRITILLTGIDKNVDRNHSLTDTLLVISADPVTGRVAMVSFPRDIAQFPLYNGATYQGKINSLMTYAANHPEDFPDGPLATLAHELGYLLGVPIQYFAAVDLDGFQRMIAAIGGVTVNVERAIADPVYNWLDGSPRGFYLAAGRQRLDARTALAFVRSRYGAGDNDFTRAARQQQLLVALRNELTNLANVGAVPAVLEVAGETIRTNFPPDRLDEMLGIANAVDAETMERFVLRPPTYSVHPPTSSTGGTYILRLKLDALRQLSVNLFGEDSSFWTGTYGPDGSPIPATAN
jgi:polyisoprenyl-teichoic acid--peptidoglycan teichoic acid transferase